MAASDLRTVLRDKNIRHGGITRNGRPSKSGFGTVHPSGPEPAANQFPDLLATASADGRTANC